MPPPDQFGVKDLLADVTRFTDRIDAEGQTLQSAEHRQLFARIVADLREASAKADELFPAIGEYLQKVGENGLARAESTLAEIQAEMEKLQATPAAPPAAPRPPAPPPEVPFDSALGGSLRDDLLGKLFPDAAGQAPPVEPGKDIWQDWE